MSETFLAVTTSFLWLLVSKSLVKYDFINLIYKVEFVCGFVCLMAIRFHVSGLILTRFGVLVCFDIRMVMVNLSNACVDKPTAAEQRQGFRWL